MISSVWLSRWSSFTKYLLRGGLFKDKYARVFLACSVSYYWANWELGISSVELAKMLKIAQSTPTQSIICVSSAGKELLLRSGF